ncbi:ATP-dependent RNA helicase DHX36-like [Spodoptera litura]|uniref:RNA helicase n=1 Tax=Spodoptera litura TaxID=69820 RepID=A0A9J7IQU6_SPOLT|nr:ATP-dependent RNA helicase DHX36-like [Spodoptera litura]
MSRRSNWNRASYKNQNRGGRPHGLRGKDIGLYYRDLQRNKNKNMDLDYMINLSVPPAVLTSLQKNIQSIKKIAKEHNIHVPPPKRLNFVTIKKDDKSEHRYDRKSSYPAHKNKYSDQSTSLDTPSTSWDYNMQVDDVKESNAKEAKVGSSGEEDLNTGPEKAKSSLSSDERQPGPLRGAGDYKYGYEDIITGTFEEKLEKCLNDGVNIAMNNPTIQALNESYYENYKTMINVDKYIKMKTFRERLPTYKKTKELLEMFHNNQVVVISGETGCGKSTQIPQIILDNAIVNKNGANVHILVTQPRRIAASSLAMRVAEERSEKVGTSIGYAVRLEVVDQRPRGSIKFCTTGVLLAELEINQGLTNYSHVILDEVHERDCDIDISMLMLKQVLKQRKDLKLILMSATIDADRLRSYFDDCPVMHIEGLAYPVEDIYLEDILQMTKYIPSFDQGTRAAHKGQRQKWKRKEEEMERDIQYKAEIAPWLESVKKQLPREVYTVLKDARIEDLNINIIYELLLYICKGKPGAVLIFLPGIGDITNLLKMIETSNNFPKSRFAIYPLHSKLPSLEQQKIFQRPPDYIRKIILATNIAETSITIDDIVYVIDCGKIKYSGLNIEDNIPTLRTEWVAQANLRQRRGRAGRCQPGICYHLVTSFRASQLAERLLPEIQRNSLLEPVLAIKKLRLGKASLALSKMPSPPAETTVERAVKRLSQIGALDNDEKLTPLGWHLARLPVHPAAGKLLLLGTLFGCLNRAASVAAVWGFKDPFQLVIGKEKEVDEAKRTLALGEPSDHVAISEAVIQFEHYRTYHEKRKFAYENFLSCHTLELLSDMKRQFAGNLKQMGFLRNADIKSPWENRNMDNLSLFKAIVAASLYPNIATVKWKNINPRKRFLDPRLKVRTPEDGSVSLHPSSVMAFKSYPPGRGYPLAPVCDSPGATWLVYWLKQRSSDLFLFDVTLIYTLPFLFFGELAITEAPDPSNYCILISNIKVSCNKTTMDLLWELRSLLDQVLAAKISSSNINTASGNVFENQVLDAVMELITAEDECLDFISDNDSESDRSEYDSRRSWRR